MARFACAFLLLTAAAVAVAQSAPKKNWDLADEERIARRLDPASIRARAPEGKEAEYTALSISVIDGRLHPELYMPWELYTDAVREYFAMPDDWVARARARANDELRVITDPIAFWRLFDEASEPYASMLKREMRGIERLNAAAPADRPAMIRQLEAEQAPQCAVRARALAAVEKALGRDVLYTFLYEIVAARSVSTITGAEDAEQLRSRGRGCR